MKAVLFISLTHVATAIRERVTLFWFLIFPVFMLVILSMIFGQIAEEREISFDITLVNLDRSEMDSSGFAARVTDAFEGLAGPTIAAQAPLFTLHQPGGAQAPADFLEAELNLLRRGRRAAVVVIPDGFGNAVLHGVVHTENDAQPAMINVYMSRTSIASETATEIIGQVLAEVDRAILIGAERFDPKDEIESRAHWLRQEEAETRYIDFLLPGIILMAFFTNGLFGVPGAILFNRDRRILRRYWVTPLSVPRYLAGFSLGHLALCCLQFWILFLLGRYGFGATISFAQPDALLTLVLAAATFMAFGFLIAAVARTANAGMATANILNMPMMFLSGMFFPVSGLPPFIMAIVYANPVSYLVNGLRVSLGVESSFFQPALMVLVPLAWIGLSVAVAARKLRWDVER